MIEAHGIIKNPSTWKDSITLDFDNRCRRRCMMKTDKGLSFLLNLPQSTVLKDGDFLELTDGTAIMVKAACEDVLEFRGNASSLALIAWSMGNRHTPIEVLPQGIRIRYDSVLEHEFGHYEVDMVRHAHAFNPKGPSSKHVHAHE